MNYKLDKEETDLMKSIEKGEWKRVQNYKEEISLLRQAARNTLRKEKRVNIRMTEKDLSEIQIRAVEEGIPYQTLMSSILHKYVSGKILIKKAA
jgi:predicted DNA binding CopG/RHH family protein